MRIRVRQTFFFYVCVVLKLRIYSQGNYVFDSTNLQINALNINTKESEFGPFKIDNKLFYTSSRERRIGVINLEKATGRQMLDLYSGELKDSVTVTNRKPLRNKINNSLHQGAAFFDKQTSKLYYAGNVPADWSGERYKLAIFSSELKDDKFQKPKVELLLPDTFLVSHPMVYNNKLYFSSNLKGGKGKADLYSAELVNGKWTNIKNLEQLNSPYDDYFPFAVSENEIYFSSNRPGGFGKLDLYKYTAGDSSAKIQNLGKPINSAFDDYAIYVEPGQDKGYFTTNRNGSDDIYHFKKTWPSFNNCVAAIKDKYCYDLTDEKSLDTDSIKGYFYEWDFGDGTKQKGTSVTHCYLEPGTYLINLNIVDVSTKAVFLNQTSLDLKVDSIVQLKINALDTMLVNKKFTVNTLGTYLPGKKILGYYFEVDDKRLRTEAFEYSFAKTGKYRIKLGIEYDDLVTKTRGLMCTTLDINCVDSAAWLPFEQKELDKMIAKFEARNLKSNGNTMADMDYDAELAINSRLGLSREKLADKIDDYLGSENGPNKNLGNNKDGLSNMSEDAELALQNKEKDGNNKNLGNNKDGLSNMSEDAELALQNKGKDGNNKNLGNNKDGLSNMSEDAELALQNKGKDGNNKNLGNNKDGLSNMSEDAELALQNKGKDGNNKNLGNNKDGLSNMSEDAELALQNKGKDGNNKNLGNNKDGLSNMSEDAELALKNKNQATEAAATTENPSEAKTIKGAKTTLPTLDEEAELVIQKADSYTSNRDSKNLGVHVDTLLNLNEDAGMTFRVHLGKSKTQKDTTLLNAKGIYGIKEEVINNEYYYSYGNEARVNNIERYYKKALRAGIKAPVILAYKNNVLVYDQSRQFKVADFGGPVKQEKPLTIKEKIKAIFKKEEPKAEEQPVAMQPAEPAKEQPVTASKEKEPVKTGTKDTAIVKNTPKETVAPQPEHPEIEPANPDKGPLGPPVEKKEKKKTTPIEPIALKPDEVKLEDARTPESQAAAAARVNLNEFVEKHGDDSAPDLQFRVQISAFKYRNRYEFPHLANLGEIENTLTEGGITRITIGGQFNTYKKALEHAKKVIAAGQKDAFVTAFYQGRRVYVENLEKMGIFVTK